MDTDRSVSRKPRGFANPRPPAVPGRRARRGLPVLLVAALASAVACASAQAAGGTVTRTFTGERSEQPFAVPAGVHEIDVVAVGGAGAESGESAGGVGARVGGELTVTPGHTLYVEVGYEGTFGVPSTGGGGASDVRTSPRADGLSPDDRLIVAGAGGAAGEDALEGGESEVHNGGAGGNAGEAEGEEGGDGIYGGGGGGGTQSAGGFAGAPFGPYECGKGTSPQAGALEAGGRGGYCQSNGGIEGGQGGSGYYGGGGGVAGFSGGGGGGGSSLVPAGGSFALAEGASPQVQISYTQPPNAPAVVTGAASETRRETTTLNGTVNPEDEEVTSCEFEYGDTESYGATVPCSSSPGSGIAPVAVSAHVTGLHADSPYYYRLVATNGSGTTYGSGESVTTLADEPPSVTAISPEAGPAAGGATVTISGTELDGATAVRFGSTEAASFTVDSNESITAVTPAGKGTVGVYVTTPSGTSSGSVHFAFLARPMVTGTTPGTGPAAGGTTVTVYGSGFDSASTVSFGGSAAASVTYVSGEELTAVSPPGTETVYVTVTTPYAGTSGDTAEGRFGYETGAPEYGACLAAAGFGSGFTKSSCEETTPTRPRYRWDPGAEKPGFTAASSGAATLETTGKTKVTCSSAAITGTITSRGTSGETIRFRGCSSPAGSCSGSGLASGELLTSPLQGALGWESKAKNKIVLALVPLSQPFLRYACGSGASTTVTGSLLVPVKAGKMEASSKIKLKATHGKQKPESLEDGERDVLSSSTGGGPAEQTGLTLNATQVDEQELEVNPRV